MLPPTVETVGFSTTIYMIYYTKDNYVYTHFVEGGNKTTIKDVDDIDCRMVTLNGNKLIVNKCRSDVIYQKRRKTPPFRAGDIRRVRRLHVSVGG